MESHPHEPRSCPRFRCQECGAVIHDRLARVVWRRGSSPQVPRVLCGGPSGCIAKPKYRRWPCAPLRDQLVFLIQNSGLGDVLRPDVNDYLSPGVQL
jgi:hypothetical protein